MKTIYLVWMLLKITLARYSIEMIPAKGARSPKFKSRTSIYIYIFYFVTKKGTKIRYHDLLFTRLSGGMNSILWKKVGLRHGSAWHCSTIRIGPLPHSTFNLFKKCFTRIGFYDVDEKNLSQQTIFQTEYLCLRPYHEWPNGSQTGPGLYWDSIEICLKRPS